MKKTEDGQTTIKYERMQPYTEMVAAGMGTKGWTLKMVRRQNSDVLVTGEE